MNESITVYEGQGVIMAVRHEYDDANTRCTQTYVAVNQDILAITTRNPKTHLDGKRILKRSGNPEQGGIPESIFWFFQRDAGSLESRLRLSRELENGNEFLPESLRGAEIKIERYDPKNNFVRFVEGI
jgi:hypothetical protein